MRSSEAQVGLAAVKAAIEGGSMTNANWVRGEQGKEKFLPEVARRQCGKWEGGKAFAYY